MSEIKEPNSGAIRRLIVESGRLAVKDGGKMFPVDFRDIIIAAVQEYNEAATLADNSFHGAPLISSNDFG